MSINNVPPAYPLQGRSAAYDCRLTNPNGKLSDTWLHNEYEKLSLISPQHQQASRESPRESRKRIRNVGDRENIDDNSTIGDRESTESCDDMIISDTDSSSQNFPLGSAGSGANATNTGVGIGSNRREFGTSSSLTGVNWVNNTNKTNSGTNNSGSSTISSPAVNNPNANISSSIRENGLIHPPKRRLTSAASPSTGTNLPTNDITLLNSNPPTSSEHNSDTGLVNSNHFSNTTGPCNSIPQNYSNPSTGNHNHNIITQAATPSSNFSNSSISTNMGRSRSTFAGASDQHGMVHPRTPNALDSPTSTPVSDIDEQPQQLPLPSPSASPVQSGQDKPTVFDPIESALGFVPTTQQELLDLILNLSGFLHDSNKNHLVFQLLQGVNRSSLSTFNDIIHNSLKRDLISNLPLEISYKILSHLGHKSLLSASLVCKNWNRILDNTDIWAQLVKKDKLLNDDAAIEEELAHPDKLVAEWAADPKHPLQHMNVAQLLYKKRSTILRRWMTPWYEPKRISVPGQGSNVVTCLQHDDDKIITGIDDKLINIYNTKTGELLKVLKGHEGGVWALKYTGNTLVSGSTDRTVRVWNIRTGRCTHVFRGHTSTVRCLDILQPVKIGKNDNGEDIYFPEVPLLVTGSRDHNLHVWKLPLDNETATDDQIFKEQQVYDSTEVNNPYLVTILTGHTQSVRSVTGYGNIIVSGSYDTTVRVWDLLDGGRCKFVLEGHSDRIYSTALNFHTKRCYSGSMDSSINVWDIEKGELLYSLEGHSSLVGLLELSDDYLVSAAADSTLRVWDPQSPENYSKLKGHSGAITCFQHDSLRVVSGSERMLKLWNIETGQFVRDLLADITGGIWQVRFDVNRCVAAVQRTRNEVEETFIEILDFSVPPSRTPIVDGNRFDVIELLPYENDDNMKDETP